MPARLPYAARVPALVAGIAAASLLIALQAAAPVASAQSATAPRVVIAFMPIADRDPRAVDDDIEPELAYQPILDRLDARKQLAIGMSSAAQGRYDPIQALLDITQGTRVSLSTYSPRRPPELRIFLTEDGGALFQGWLDTIARADSAPADLVPGLLAGSIPGGAAYVGVHGRSQSEAIVAADRSGRIPAVSLGRAATLAARVREQLRSRRLVVAGLPTAYPGDAALDQLIKQRRPNELLIVTQTPPDRSGPQLLPTGVLGLGGSGQLTSDTTHIDGIVAGIDFLPTVLDWLRQPVPDSVKGQQIEVVPGRNAAALESRADRLRVVLPRRLPALWSLLGGWLALLLAATLFADRRGTRWALRVGSLAVLWVPAVVLITAALEPSRTLELMLVAVLALALAAATDALVAWPRGPAVPAIAALVAYIVDLAFGSPLIIRSLLGPNPLYGSRFYGIGNELEATLPALLLIGVGALFYGRGRSRTAVWAFAGGGVVLGVMIGAGRLGADVGGVITVAAGAAVGALLMLPGGVTKRALALAIAAPALAIAGLAAIDLLTGGDSHFTRTVLRANGSGALWDVLSRRYELAGRATVRGFMPAATLIAVLALVCGLRYRERLLAPTRGDAAITAALGGTIAVGVAGALFNDSGPILLLFATFIAACLVLYVRGDPRLAAADSPRHAPPDGAALVPEPPLDTGLASPRPDPAPSAR